MNDNMYKYWVHPQADQKDIENMLEKRKRKRNEQQKRIEKYEHEKRKNK